MSFDLLFFLSFPTNVFIPYVNFGITGLGQKELNNDIEGLCSSRHFT